jgi:hypothetical protein
MRASCKRRHRRVGAKNFFEPATQQSAPDASEQFSGGAVHEADAFACIDADDRRRQRF